MMSVEQMQRISTCMWFDDVAEQAAEYYVSIFPLSQIVRMTHFGEAGSEIHGHKAGSVLTVEFDLDGQRFTALNGGPMFKFTEAMSLVVNCDSQAEIDYYWEKLTADGDPNAQQCGWLKDKFGVSWQVVPAGLTDMISSSNSAASERVMNALLEMHKLDLSKLQEAFNDGEAG